MNADGRNLKHILLIMLLILVLIGGIPVLTACDDDDEETSPSVADTSGATETSDAATQASPVSEEPVKIGAINAWSGAAAVAGLLGDAVTDLVVDQVEEMGGILGGRPIEIVKYDNKAVVSNSVLGVQKLLLKDDVAAIVFGGTSVPEITATSDACEDEGMPFFSFSPLGGLQLENKYTVIASYSDEAVRERVTNFAFDVLKPNTVGVLTEQGAIPELSSSYLETAAARFGSDIDVVYHEAIPMGTMDLSPYLTKIKHADPDLLFVCFPQAPSYMSMFKQIMELGGWGDIQVLSYSPTGTSATILKMPGSHNTYSWALWAPGVSAPAAKEFEQAFFNKYGKTPDPNHPFYYNALWSAIKAIELAGSTDREDIAKAMRSGGLQLETPSGTAAFGADGEANLAGYMFEIGGDGTLNELPY